MRIRARPVITKLKRAQTLDADEIAVCGDLVMRHHEFHSWDVECAEGNPGTATSAWMDRSRAPLPAANQTRASVRIPPRLMSSRRPELTPTSTGNTRLSVGTASLTAMGGMGLSTHKDGRNWVKDLADTAGQKVAQTTQAATEFAGGVADTARATAKQATESAAGLADAASSTWADTTQAATEFAGGAKAAAKQAAESAAVFADNAGRGLVKQAGELKDAAVDTVEKLTAKKPDPYEDAIVEYNGAFTAMNDKGLFVLRQRERSTDLIELVELLVNSITNTPKSFETDFEEIDLHKAKFLETAEFTQKDLEAARQSAAGAGAGFAAGAAVASLAPTAAIWVATTFGTASTGTAISTLSGAVATNAALAWLGGGAIASGGGGMAAGHALLALAGPIGWGIAGATLLASIALFAKAKHDNTEERQQALTALKQNTALVRGIDAQIGDLLQRTVSLRELLIKSFGDAMAFFGADFLALSSSQQSQLAALVNNTKACAALLSKRIDPDPTDPTDD